MSDVEDWESQQWELAMKEADKWQREVVEFGPLGARAPLGEGCACVAEHAPSAYVPEDHHILPLSWGGPNVPENRVRLCNNTHAATHRLIDEHVRLGAQPPWEVRQHFNATQRYLAARAWLQRPEKPTLTLPPMGHA